MFVLFITLLFLREFCVTECSKLKLNQENRHLKIIGGENAKYGEFPFMLSMNTNNNHFCGASAISDYWALTAAHCVYGSSIDQFVFRAGSLKSGKNGTVHHPEKIIPHSLFSSSSKDHDIAVVKVKEPFSSNPYVTSYVSLPLQDEEPELGSEATVVGWGMTEAGLWGPVSPVLKKVVVDILKNEECSEAATSMGRFVINDDMLCAQRKGETAFKGDSGGPLLINDGEKFKQIGAVSWGDFLGTQSVPTVFTKVSKYRVWINLKTGI